MKRSNNSTSFPAASESFSRPEWSWKNVLSREGRLKNKWASVTEERDPKKATEILREVRDKLESDPQSFGHLWLDFLGDFLSRLDYVTEDDFCKLRKMAWTGDKAKVDVSASKFWFRLLIASDDVCNESLGIQILTDVSQGGSIPGRDKERAIRELARRGAADDTHLQIYVQHFSTVPEPLKEDEVLRVIKTSCASNANHFLRFQRKLVAKPIAFRSLWEPLFEYFLEGVRQRYLKEAEFQALSDMGDVVASHPQLRLTSEQIWSRLADSLVKKTRLTDLSVLYTRTYYASSATTDWKQRCARELAERTVAGHDQLAIYADYLGQCPDPVGESKVLSCLLRISLSGVEKLAAIHRIMTEVPKAFSAIWKVLLSNYFSEARGFPFSDSDFDILEGMASYLVTNPDLGVSPECIWVPLARLADARGRTEKVYDILSSIYGTTACSLVAQEWAARGLANKGSNSLSHLHIYCDHLSRSAEGPSERRMIAMLRSHCTVDFDSSDDAIASAGEVARKLVEGGFDWPWVLVAFGLYRLLIERKPSEALGYFRKASQTQLRGRTLLLGITSAWLQDGDYTRVISLASKVDWNKHPLFGKLSQLASALQWLDSHELPGPAPVHSRDIRALKIRRYAGDCVDMALGRLLLIEGMAEEAQEVLCRVCTNRGEEQRWHYYLAWAKGLSGDPEGVIKAAEKVAGWPAQWALYCLALDWDSKSVRTKKLDPMPVSEKDGYATIVAARLAMTNSTAPAPIAWKKGAGLLEEDLEALRTAMGYTFFYAKPTHLKKLTEMPLFHRLPLADQLMWIGIHSVLMKDFEKAEALLRESHEKFGYHRAALVLASLLSCRGSADGALQLLDSVEVYISTNKVDLLRASLHVSQHRLDAAERLLTAVASTDDAVAHYGLGRIRLLKADLARTSADSQRFKAYHLEAGNSFRDSLNACQGSSPKDCQFLAGCSLFVALPEEHATGCCFAWSEVEAATSSHELGPWVKWHTLLASLWNGDSRPGSLVFHDIENLMNSAGALHEKVAYGIATMLVRAHLLCADTTESQNLVDCLNRLSSAYPLAPVRRWRDIGSAALVRRLLREGNGDARLCTCSVEERGYPNTFYSLVIAQHALRTGDLATACTSLGRVEPGDSIEAKVCQWLAQLLQGMEPILDHKRVIPSDQHPKVMLGTSLMAAATEFAKGNLQQAYQQIAELLVAGESDWGEVLDPEKLLVGLFAQMVDRSDPPPSVIALLERLCTSQKLYSDPSLLARCAAAIGESEMACGMWSRAIDRDGSMRSNERELFSRYLCHLASKAAMNGDVLGAAERIRSAAQVMPH